jgi:dCMP deaminase
MITSELVAKLTADKCGVNDQFMLAAMLMATHSHCVKKHVGAVVVKNDRIVSTGYNGAPGGFWNCDEKFLGTGCARANDGSCSLSVHAEMNAMIFALKNRIDLDGSSLFVTMSPCLPCARTIFQLGIKRVVYLESYVEWKKTEQGVVLHDDGIDFLSRCFISFGQHRFVSQAEKDGA